MEGVIAICVGMLIGIIWLIVSKNYIFTFTTKKKYREKKAIESEKDWDIQNLRNKLKIMKGERNKLLEKIICGIDLGEVKILKTWEDEDEDKYYIIKNGEQIWGLIEFKNEDMIKNKKKLKKFKKNAKKWLGEQ